MGAVEKQTTFSHRSHRAWKTRQPDASFPQFPQSLLRDQMRRKKAKLLYCSFQPLLHFQIESAIRHFPFLICHFLRVIWASFSHSPAPADLLELKVVRLKMKNDKRKIKENN